MLTVQPRRVREIRKARRMTFEQLHDASGVSTRQIMRIEGAVGPFPCRPSTLESLARALRVDVRVLAGEAPLPPDVASHGDLDLRVDAEQLRKQRQRRGLSQEALATASGVSKSQIQRIERGDVRGVRHHTLVKLARALRADADVLLGRAPVEDGNLPATVQMSARVSKETRLGYDLLAKRYGIGAKQVIELAPLLFALLAEASLAARREKLEEAVEVRNALVAKAKDDPMLYFAKYLVDVDAGIGAEEDSIAEADVLGRLIWQGEGLEAFHEDDLNVTPFENYLREFGERLDVPGIVRIEEFPLLMTDLWGVSSYRVCGDFLDEVAGGSEGARLALECGDVRLSEIPEELMSRDATIRRTEWLEARLGEEGRELQGVARSLEELVASFDPGNPGDGRDVR